MKYREYKQLDLSSIGKEVLDFWNKEKVFEKSISSRPDSKPYTFYEGPPSANGMPGIHHVMARAIKDIFCRYKTLQGFQVKRKGGWDTHGLPIELAVEKAMGITKEDIGKKISVHDYNEACRKEVMRYTNVWNDLTLKMGYWVDLDDPYITYKNGYIESLWWILSEFYKKGLLYKGYTIQPFSPAAGTGLSSHELNQPGTYKMVKDTSAIVQFQLKEEGKRKMEVLTGSQLTAECYFLAWTTTPWTLPSNTALAVGKNIEYWLIDTWNKYTHKRINVVIASALVPKIFDSKTYFLVGENQSIKDLSELRNLGLGTEQLEYKVLGTLKGKDLAGISYEQLMPYAQPTDGDAFKVLIGDFVSTEDGTGIVHLAPSFGSDDFRVAQQNKIGSLTLVDKQGRFTEEVKDFAHEYVKEAFLTEEEKEKERLKQGRDKYLSVDERIAIKLKEENKAFKVERYEHSYPHCWRTDKPILYYPLDSWFIKTTAVKDRMVELNKTINWKPESTGTGRFGNWLENLVDWNLSRSRYWGTPLPIWRTEDAKEEICIGSVEELRMEVDKSVKAGFMANNPYLNTDFDLHRPYVDDIILVSASGKKMLRELDLIDVWFDSGAMPYAQWHYPFENKDIFSKSYPADFIAEGVDQTRGWFFTLHAISVMLFDKVAYKNVVSNGLVLDKNGNKMSKRLGNATDPFETIEKYGPDATRWYLISNAAPWENLKFNIEGLAEVQRKFFGTLYNTYSFFALYANIDSFVPDRKNTIPVAERPELDRWILSRLQQLCLDTEEYYENYEPHRAARAIQEFVDEHLSNWYVRLARRRFWKGEMTEDKRAAYETLHECLFVISQLMSPIAPFFADWLYKNLDVSNQELSVHLSQFPSPNKGLIDEKLNESMQMAQDISSMILSLRKKVDIRVRQPLQKVLIPVLDKNFEKKVSRVQQLILSETNIKEIEFISDASGILVKKIKPNFKILGKKAGALMKELANAITMMDQIQIAEFESKGTYAFDINGSKFTIDPEDAELISEDIPGWLVANMGKLTVALDINITKELKDEGLARELINRTQNLRKEKGFEVTDKIRVHIQANTELQAAIDKNLAYICSEILATSVNVSQNDISGAEEADIDGSSIKILIEKLN